MGLSLKKHSLYHIHHTIHLVQGAVSFLSYHVWRVYFPNLLCSLLNEDLAGVEDWFWSREENQPLDVGLRPDIRREIHRIKPMLRPPDGVPLVNRNEDWARLLSLTWWWLRHKKQRNKSLASYVEESLGEYSGDVWHIDEAERYIKEYKLSKENY
jgi:hypothetical protein